MNFLEKIISWLAPHRCIICGFVGELLCSPCQDANLLAPPSRCYSCHALTIQSRVCKSCKPRARLSHVWVATPYEGAAKELIYRLKFGRTKAGAVNIAQTLAGMLPDLPEDVLISHIPTAPNRVRARGYDQSKLIAKSLCTLMGRRRQNLLIRTGKSRQVGSGRKQRFLHLEKALSIQAKADIKSRHILLVDDITTTGATIEAAAKLLKDNGAKTVDAVLFAQA